MSGDPGGAFAAPPGDPAALFESCDTVERLAGRVGDLAAGAGRTTADVRARAEWSGNTADAYTRFTGGMSVSLAGAESPLTRIAASVRRYAEVLAAAKREIAAAAQAAHAAQVAQASGDPNAATTIATARHHAERQHAAVRQAAEESSKEVGGAREELLRLWERSEPVREWIDKLKAPWDAAGADKGLAMLIERGEAPTKWAGKLPDLIDDWFHTEVAGLAHDADNGLVPWSEVDAAAARYGSKVDAATTFTQGWLNDTRFLRGATPFLKGASASLSVVGIGTDIVTAISPEDRGAMGWVDRGAAGVNGGLLAANLFVDEIPVAGEVMMIGTGVYLGGDYLYHHWKPFHNAVDAVGHGTVTVTKDIGHGVTSAVKSVGHLFGL